MGNVIELKHISKTFDGEQIFSDINLEIGDNEFVTLLGPSGCGKTTTLRIIGGFEHPDQGEVLFMGKKVNDIPPYKRQVNTVFQKYALFPHLDVYENVAFPLREKKVAKAEIQNRVEEMLSLVMLSNFKHRKVTSLSGGQQQRVAIARALINHPKVLLLDEPLGALDLKLRKDMQQELKKIQKETGITFIFVTHDQGEALSMSDRIVVMSDGQIQQIGSPSEIYGKPKNAFVADFIGESNILDGVMKSPSQVQFAGRIFSCEEQGFLTNQPVDVVIRPEMIRIVPVEQAALSGTVTAITFLGVHNEVIVDINGFKWMVQTIDQVTEGEKIGLQIPASAIHIMNKSIYSDLYGDYSSYSEEIYELQNPGGEDEE